MAWRYLLGLPCRGSDCSSLSSRSPLLILSSLLSRRRLLHLRRLSGSPLVPGHAFASVPLLTERRVSKAWIVN